MMPNQRRIIFIAGLIVVLGVMAALGYRYWYQPTYDFFNTDDAAVSGSLVRVAAPASGQVSDVFVEVGSSVSVGEPLATIKVVSTLPGGAVAGPAVPRVLARVTSPISGTVAMRPVSVGDTVAPGQVIAMIVDLNGLWIVANVDEVRATEVRPGLDADVQIAAANETFRGKVTEIGSATTDLTAAPSIGGLGTSDTTKKVPVKIVFEYTGYRLVPGMSATVTIYTRVGQ